MLLDLLLSLDLLLARSALCIVLLLSRSALSPLSLTRNCVSNRRFQADSKVFSWTAMIHGLASHGKCKEALRLFGEMESSGVKPDGRKMTYSRESILFGEMKCKEALRLFGEMKCKEALRLYLSACRSKYLPAQF